MKNDEFQRLLWIVLSSSGEVRWQDLSEKERRAVEQFAWLHSTHPLILSRMIKGGLDYVWERVRQTPLLYGLA